MTSFVFHCSVAFTQYFRSCMNTFINRKVYIFLFLFLCMGTLKAQNYTRDAGLRLGYPFSVTFRQFYSDDDALECMLSIGRHSVTITALKELFAPALRHFSENTFFIYGFGAHAGIASLDHYRVLNRTYLLNDRMITTLVGIDGLIGFEYRLSDLPFLLSTDFKPYFEYSTIQFFNLNLLNFCISVKYRF
jgi:hypothetical protein